MISVMRLQMLDNKRLRFAPLVRVSTEKQEKRGESLNTQRKQLKQAINNLNGTIYRWYTGQEHATPDNERKILNDLIDDAQAGKFDAIMVADISRWSRDNQMSKKYLNILRDNQIQFYWLGRHMDLSVPFNNLVIGMGTEINEFFAAEQSYKSIINRIELAKRGIPVAGKLPYGRTYNEKTNQWSIDKKKKEIVKDAAERYISGESMESIAVSHNMNTSNLHKLLKERCGDKWTIRFRCTKNNIDETIQIEIPRLLPEFVIGRIHERSESNKTYNHGSYKYSYLLSGIIFDSATNYALTGTANAKHQRYYRPFKGRVKQGYMINADVIENAFVEGFVDFLNDANKRNALSDGDSIKNRETELKTKLKGVNKDLDAKKKMKVDIERRLLMCDKDLFADLMERLSERMRKLKDDISSLEFKADAIRNQLTALPTAEEVEDMFSQLKKRTSESYERCGLDFESRPFNEKKKIINDIFGGQDENGHKYGIYVTPSVGKHRSYEFKAYGRVGHIYGKAKARTGYYESFAMKTQCETRSPLH